MKGRQRHITVFEHDAIRLGDVIEGVTVTQGLIDGFEAFYGEKGVPWFSLIHKGVRFNEHVGVIQVGDTLVEVLPKADRRFAGTDEKKQWRDLLIDMIFAAGIFDIHAPSRSSLTLQPNSILDLYFELFISETEYLLHSGLVKKYHRTEGNNTALKGNLLFAKHIQQNLTHQERFYTRYTTYDTEHLLHRILYKSIRLLHRINTIPSLHSRIGNLLLNFPEMPPVHVSDTLFERIVYTRKTQAYKTSVEIARLLLLQYHPDVVRGTNDVLALMFDMNILWERFVYASLRRNKSSGTTVHGQMSAFFWKPAGGYRSKIVADIVINRGKPDCAVIDTKWKTLQNSRPFPEDLKQMYVYHHYYGARRVALVYPGGEFNSKRGCYLESSFGKETDHECSLIFLPVMPDVRDWQKEIYKELAGWIRRKKGLTSQHDKPVETNDFSDGSG